MDGDAPFYHDVDGRALAVRASDGRPPCVVWLGGYRSDMKGTKAMALDARCRREGRAFLRFDYSGHGESGGSFEEGTISRWATESVAIISAYAGAAPILVGSSMGAWIALLATARLRAAGTGPSGLVLVAPAPDFTTDLIEPNLTDAQRRQLKTEGRFTEQYDPTLEPNVYTKALLEDGARHHVLTGPIDTHCPVHIITGSDDAVVPVDHALKLMSLLPADDVTFTLVKGGDHRLSRPDDIALLERAVLDIAERVAP
jgi:pimeloyl-ACP methyl ester carboxylesterase